ncbi:recombinase family protein [Streptomyces sp. N2A]|uniref:recombinase family protein n=1 Tax=Streptomyces sp. N2A TaxID=3073936 RepID=UPI00287031BC|nr:recombinase family protein [Streptomyces sp. N2A]
MARLVRAFGRPVSAATAQGPEATRSSGAGPRLPLGGRLRPGLISRAAAVWRSCPVPAVRTGGLVGYARVSTKGQLLDRQIQSLTEAGCIRSFADKKSGKNAERKELWNAQARRRSVGSGNQRLAVGSRVLVIGVVAGLTDVDLVAGPPRALFEAIARLGVVRRGQPKSAGREVFALPPLHLRAGLGHGAVVVLHP